MADSWIIIDGDETHHSNGAADSAPVLEPMESAPMFGPNRDDVGVQTDDLRCTVEGEDDGDRKGPVGTLSDDAPTSVTRVSISLNTDATGSVAPFNVQMKNVLKTVLTAGKEFGVRAQVVLYVMIGAMRDWCDRENVYELVLNKEGSTVSGRVVPFVFTGADDQYDTIIRAIDALATNGCHGGGDAPEEYCIGVSVAREFFRQQREQHGPHPQFALFCTDDVAHGFSDTSDSCEQGTGHMPLTDKGAYFCPYAPSTDEVSGKRMWRGGNAVAELGRMLDDGVYVVWCAVGTAAVPRQCEKWLVALTSCMEKTDERTGFVFRYRNEQDAVPSTISTLFLHLVKSKSVPYDVCDVKRDDLIRREVGEVLKATVRTLRKDEQFPQTMLEKLENADALLVDNLNNLAAMSLNDAATRTQIAAAAEDEKPDAMARYRSMVSAGRSLSNPIPYEYDDEGGRDRPDGSGDRVEGEATTYRSLSCPMWNGFEEDSAPTYRSLAATKRKADADCAGPAANAPRDSDAEAREPRGFDRKDAIRKALARW